MIERVTGYAVIDTETTGFSPKTGDRVLEIAVVHLDVEGRVQESWETLLNPARDVGATHVHGITAGDIEAAPRFDQVAIHVEQLLTGRVVVGHNIAFDLRFLSAEFSLASRPVPPVESLCTQMLAANYLPGPKRTLAICCEQAGIVNTHAHSALGDTLATAELFQFYLRHHTADDAPWRAQVEAAAALVTQHRTEPDLFDLFEEPAGQVPVLRRASARAR